MAWRDLHSSGQNAPRGRSPLADPRGRSDTGDHSGMFTRAEPPSFLGSQLSLAAKRAPPTTRLRILNSGELVRRPCGSQRKQSRCSGLWRRSRIEQVRRGFNLNAAIYRLLRFLLLFPSRSQRDASTAGTGWGVGGTGEGELRGLILPNRCQESPKQKTTNGSLSFIYADKPVVSSLTPPTQPQLSLVSWCPAWLDGNLFKSCLDRLMEVFPSDQLTSGFSAKKC